MVACVRACVVYTHVSDASRAGCRNSRRINNHVGQTVGEAALASVVRKEKKIVARVGRGSLRARERERRIASGGYSERGRNQVAGNGPPETFGATHFLLPEFRA